MVKRAQIATCASGIELARRKQRARLMEMTSLQMARRLALWATQNLAERHASLSGGRVVAAMVPIAQSATRASGGVRFRRQCSASAKRVRCSHQRCPRQQRSLVIPVRICGASSLHCLAVRTALSAERNGDAALGRSLTRAAFRSDCRCWHRRWKRESCQPCCERMEAHFQQGWLVIYFSTRLAWRSQLLRDEDFMCLLAACTS